MIGLGGDLKTHLDHSVIANMIATAAKKTYWIALSAWVLI